MKKAKRIAAKSNAPAEVMSEANPSAGRRIEVGMDTMVEKARQWLTVLPAWIPIAGSILFAALWIGQHYQSITDRLDTLEHQMRDVQDYMRHDHKKIAAEGPDSLYNAPQNPAQDAQIPAVR